MPVRPPALELWDEAEDELLRIERLQPATTTSSSTWLGRSWLKVLTGNLSSGLLHAAVLLAMTVWAVQEELPRHSEPLALATETDGESSPLEQLSTGTPNEPSVAESSTMPLVFSSDSKLEMSTPKLNTQLLTSGTSSYKSSFNTGAVAGGNAAVGPEVNFFGSKAVGHSFVFVLDASGSMNDGQRFARAANELMQTLAGLNENHKFCVLAFNDQTWPMLNSPLNQVALLPANEENKARLKVWLNTLRPIGWTDPRSAIGTALQLSPSAIFLLSDGEFKQGPPERKLGYTTLSGVHRANREHVPIHTLAFEDPANAAVLRGMAKASGGSYRYVPPESRRPD